MAWKIGNGLVTGFRKCIFEKLRFMRRTHYKFTPPRNTSRLRVGNKQRETAGPDLTLTTLLTARRHTGPSHTRTRAFPTPPSWQVLRWPTGYTAALRSTAVGPLGTYLIYSDVQGFAEHSTTAAGLTLRSLASMSPRQHTHSQKHISVGKFQENSAYRLWYRQLLLQRQNETRVLGLLQPVVKRNVFISF